MMYGPGADVDLGQAIAFFFVGSIAASLAIGSVVPTLSAVAIIYVFGCIIDKGR